MFRLVVTIKSDAFLTPTCLKSGLFTLQCSYIFSSASCKRRRFRFSACLSRNQVDFTQIRFCWTRGLVCAKFSKLLTCFRLSSRALLNSSLLSLIPSSRAELSPDMPFNAAWNHTMRQPKYKLLSRGKTTSDVEKNSETSTNKSAYCVFEPFLLQQICKFLSSSCQIFCFVFLHLLHAPSFHAESLTAVRPFFRYLLSRNDKFSSKDCPLQIDKLVPEDLQQSTERTRLWSASPVVEWLFRFPGTLLRRLDVLSVKVLCCPFPFLSVVVFMVPSVNYRSFVYLFSSCVDWRFEMRESHLRNKLMGGVPICPRKASQLPNWHLQTID